MPATTVSTSSSAIPRVATQPKQMNSAELVQYYTAKLVLGEDPSKALKRLWTIGYTMKQFEDASTEKAMERYENDYMLRGLVEQLREKFANMRRREARDAKQMAQKSKLSAVTFDKKFIEEVKKQEREISQFDAKDLFADALKQIGHKETVSKSKVDYSKFNIVKRAKKPTPPVTQISTPKRILTDRSRRSVSIFSTSSGSSSSDASPQYN